MATPAMAARPFAPWSAATCWPPTTAITRSQFQICTSSNLGPTSEPPNRPYMIHDLRRFLSTDFTDGTDQRNPCYPCYPRSNPCHPWFIPSAFSLIELMVAVGLMSLVVLGLLVMFQQTQRAFTGSMTQVDMLEGARATTDLIERELEQMTPSHTPYAANFVSELAPPDLVFAPGVTFQDLPGTGSPPLRRLNVLHHFFFLTRENQTWRGIGYLVGPPAFGVGTLYRFWQETNSSVETLRTNFDTAAAQLYYHNRVTTNLLTRMVDGVVHLRVRAYNTNGFLIVS